MPTAIDFALGVDVGPARGRGALFVLLALALHGGLAIGLRGGHAPVRIADVTSVTEVELPPPPPPEPEAVRPEPAPEEATPTAVRAAAPPPQAARAGALITAKESAPSAKNDELVDFVTDPAGTSYGSGVVARGGAADHGAKGATAAGVGSAPVPVTAAPPGDALVPASNLSRRAALKERDACAGYYPSEADADSGSVTLTVVVRADGVVTSTAVVAESPPGQGFGKAARACLTQKRFEPSLDRAGSPVAAATSIKLRFVR